MSYYKKHKLIPVTYNDEINGYEFTCPFCGKLNHPHEDTCEHVAFVYEEVNSEPFYVDSGLYLHLCEILCDKKLNFLEGLYEEWECSYKPEQSSRSVDPDMWDKAKEDAVSDYVNSRLTIEEFFKILNKSELKYLLSKMQIAATEEDYDGRTYFVLLPSEELAKLNKLYLDTSEIKEAFEDYLRMEFGFDSSEAKAATMDFPDPYGNCYLRETFVGHQIIDGVKYQKYADWVDLDYFSMHSSKIFKFYTYYNEEDVADNKVGSFRNARKLYQIRNLDRKDFVSHSMY